MAQLKFFVCLQRVADRKFTVHISLFLPIFYLSRNPCRDYEVWPFFCLKYIISFKELGVIAATFNSYKFLISIMVAVYITDMPAFWSSRNISVSLTIIPLRKNTLGVSNLCTNRIDIDYTLNCLIFFGIFSYQFRLRFCIITVNLWHHRVMIILSPMRYE